MKKRRVLFVGDGPDVPSGFGRATREILARLIPEYEVCVLGINHRGDPGTVDYPVYAAAAGGDAFGVGRLIWMCQVVKPDVIVIQNDGWYFPYYFSQLRKKTASFEYENPEIASIPVIGAVAIDGLNFDGNWIKDLSATVFWTKFAESEARIGGFTGTSYVIPLGVDLNMFYKVDRDLAMERQRVASLKDKFVVGNVNRNQPRKRWDLSIRYFANWIHSRKITDARLFLHSAPTGDKSTNILSLAEYYGVLNQIVLCEPEPFYGKADDDMRDVYNCFDVLMSTTQGEGMGLPTMEAMACGVPCVLPDWSAHGDWAKGAAAMVPCTSTALQTFSPSVNVIGGVADEKAFIEALDLMYRDRQQRELIGSLGFQRVSEERFRWDNIGEQWLNVLDLVLSPPAPRVTGDVWQELKV